jgi:hypothetical protein
MAEVRNETEAHRALQVHTTARARSLDMFERYVRGTQYEGRASWWDTSKPLFERAPCVVYPIAKSAIVSHVAMVLGGHRFPVITSGTDEDDTAFDSEFGISEVDSAVLDRFIKVMVRQARLPVVCRGLLTKAMSCGTSVAIPCIRDGRFHVETVPAKFCDVEFIEDSECIVKTLEYSFAYIDIQQKDPAGRPVARCLVFRRVIDERTDTTYEPAEVSARDDAKPQWKVKRQVKHGFGFCPVVWYRFQAEETSAAVVDGEPLHGTLLDEITAMDFAVSQRHRATLFCTDPILVEIGVEPGFNPTSVVRGSILFAPGPDGAGDSAAMNHWAGGSRPATSGRQRSPGLAYQYPEGADVKLLTLAEGAMQAATENAADIEQKICETIRWCPLDPKTMQSGATLSGRALEWLHKKQIEFDDEIREEFGTDCILRLVDMLLRIVLHAGTTDKGVYIAGLGQVLPILQRFMREQEQDDGSTVPAWMRPDLRLKWGDYFKPNEQDQKARGECIRADYEAGLINLTTAVEANAAFYGYENPAQYAEDLEHQKAKKKTAEMEALHAANDLLAGKAEQGTAAEPSDATEDEEDEG